MYCYRKTCKQLKKVCLPLRNSSISGKHNSEKLCFQSFRGLFILTGKMPKHFVGDLRVQKGRNLAIFERIWSNLGLKKVIFCFNALLHSSTLRLILKICEKPFFEIQMMS